MTDKLDKIISNDENILFCANPMLPRTHDYICKNNLCPTNNKDNKINKEAVFFRENKSFNKSFKVNYICTVCYYNW